MADLVAELQGFGCEVSVHDPIADPDDARQEYGIALLSWDKLPAEADAIVAAVSHSEYLSAPLSDILVKLKKNGLFMYVKSAYDADGVRAAGRELWRL